MIKGGVEVKKSQEREIIEPGAFTKRFCSNYIAILIIVLVITNIIFQANDYENVLLIRGGAMAVTIIVGVITMTIGLSKRYRVKKSMKDFYTKYVIIAVIAIALLSIIYFMYCVKSEVAEVKESAQYKIAKSRFGTTYTDKVLEDAADEARKQWYSIWGIMIGASVVTIPMIKKIFDKYSEDEEETVEESFSNTEEIEKETN